MSRIIPPKTAVTTPIKVATRALAPESRATCVPDAAKSPSPTASGHCIAFAVGSMWRERSTTGPTTAKTITAHTQPSLATQKNGPRSSKRSRRVPPPNAVRKAITATPTASRRLVAPAKRPEAAKANTPIPSRTTSKVASVLGSKKLVIYGSLPSTWSNPARYGGFGHRGRFVESTPAWIHWGVAREGDFPCPFARLHTRGVWPQ